MDAAEGRLSQAMSLARRVPGPSLASRRAGRHLDRDAARYLLSWLLLALLFVGGLMNLAWVAAIALLALLQKTIPWGGQLSLLTGALSIEWGLVSLIRAGFAA